VKVEAAGIEPAQGFNRRLCVTGENKLAWASVRKWRLKLPMLGPS
jgi:hypothetical protein